MLKTVSKGQKNKAGSAELVTMSKHTAKLSMKLINYRQSLMSPTEDL